MPPLIAGPGSWSDIAHLTFIATTILSALLVFVTWLLVRVTGKQARVSETLAQIEQARSRRESVANLIVRRAEGYALIQASMLVFDVYVLADGPVTAQGVRVTVLLDAEPVAESHPQTVAANTEETFRLTVADADQLALKHTDGKIDSLLTRLWVRAQPVNGPPVEWRWSDGLASHQA